MMKDFLQDPRKLTGALVVSLSVNLFFGGFLAARLFRPPEVYEPQQIAALTRMGDYLPEARRVELREMMREKRQVIARSIAQARLAGEHVAEILEMEVYDMSELEEALHEIRSLNADTQAAVHEFVIQVAPQINPEVRRQMMRRMYIRRGQYERHRQGDERHETHGEDEPEDQ